MKRNLSLPVVLLALQISQTTSSSLPATVLATQTSAETKNAAETVIGEVVNIDKAARMASIRTDDGAILVVEVENKASCLRIAAGETDISRARPVDFADLGAGDRVLGRGQSGVDKKRILVHQLVVITKADIEGKRERDLADWRRRGIVGTARAINPQNGEVDLEVEVPGGTNRVLVTTENCDFRRYAAGSTSFADAKPSSFNELRIGDHLRALGDRSTDGRKFEAQRIVSGSLYSRVCVVTEVDHLKNEIKAQTIHQKQSVVISVNSDSVLRRIPPVLATDIGKAVNRSRNPGQSKQPTSDQKALGAAGSVDLEQMIDGLPTLALTDIKAGDVVAVIGSTKSDEPRITAIKFIAGVDGILNSLRPASGKVQTIQLSAGLPATAFDFSFGPP